jgi:hypothetical protein
LRKQEKFLKKQIFSIKDDLRLRKQIDNDGVPKTLSSLFMAGADSDSDSDVDSDDDALSDDEVLGFDSALGVSSYGGVSADVGASLGSSKPPSWLRRDLLDYGISARLLSLNLDDIPPSVLTVSRLMHEVVPTPLNGDLAFVFAMKPSTLSVSSMNTHTKFDVDDVAGVIEVLGDLCNGSTPSLGNFIGAADFDEHVIFALSTPFGVSLKRLCRSIGDGDIQIAPSLQLSLAYDLASAVARLHDVGVVHGSIGQETVVVTLQEPHNATLLYFGPMATKSTSPVHVSEHDDIFNLGLVFASLALGKGVTADDLSTTGTNGMFSEDFTDYTPFRPLLDLAHRMTQLQTSKVSTRPTSAEVVDWLHALLDDEEEHAIGEGDSAFKLRGHDTPSSIFELQRDPSPFRRI